MTGRRVRKRRRISIPTMPCSVLRRTAKELLPRGAAGCPALLVNLTRRASLHEYTCHVERRFVLFKPESKHLPVIGRSLKKPIIISPKQKEISPLIRSALSVEMTGRGFKKRRRISIPTMPFPVLRRTAKELLPRGAGGERMETSPGDG